MEGVSPECADTFMAGIFESTDPPDPRMVVSSELVAQTSRFGSD